MWTVDDSDDVIIKYRVVMMVMLYDLKFTDTCLQTVQLASRCAPSSYTGMLNGPNSYQYCTCTCLLGFTNYTCSIGITDWPSQSTTMASTHRSHCGAARTLSYIYTLCKLLFVFAIYMVR